MSESDGEESQAQGGFAYDPNQNPEDKRRIRKRYRGLLLDDTGNTRKANDYTTEQLVEKVREADDIFKQVKAPGEAALDSGILLEMSNIGAAKARQMKAGGASFDVDDFVAKLLGFMADPDPNDGGAGPGPLDWEKVGRLALAKSRRVPAMDFMLGPLQVEQKKRTAKQRARLEKNKAEEQKPQEIKEEDIQRSENETTKNVILIRELLEQEGQVNLFKFIVNPDDFAQSVENMFHLSFLIRDGQCAMEIEDGEPVVYICEQPSKDDFEQGLKKQQLVFEFDMETWRMAIQTFNITQPMIPQRPKAKKASGNKWYG